MGRASQYPPELRERAVRMVAEGELVSAAAHVTDQYANKRIEADHGQLKPRLNG